MKQFNRRSFLSTSLAAMPAIMLPRIDSLNISSSVAKTVYGKVQGYIFNDIHIFRNIPYGASTAGTNRFLPPKKPNKWKETLRVDKAGNRCMQSEGSVFHSPEIGDYFAGGRKDRLSIITEHESEDCLNLNVSTPSLSGSRPVMVYIHGGGFAAGSGVLTVFGDRHVKGQDVVLVGVNHRLNAFGYLYLGELDKKYETGNVGQLDIIAALEWVRDNISNFGGDPSNVTIFGESGGGAKISTLLAMPAAKGLFHKAIIQSGSLLNVSDSSQATEITKTVMSNLRISKVSDLEKMSGSDLYNSIRDLNLMRFGPVIDGRTILNQTWSPSAPEIAKDIPVLIGNDKDESTIFLLGQYELFNLDESGLIKKLTEAKLSPEMTKTAIELYRKKYPNESYSDLFFRISTDRGARYNATRQAEILLASGNPNVYMYYFQWNTKLENGKLRSFHTCDLPLIMRLVQDPDSETLSRMLSEAWANFARTGKPGGENLQWPTYTLGNRDTLVFDAKESKAVADPGREERELLNDHPSGSLL
ncbi:MAG: carboxylesterase/lipase family protein [Chitinophagaceae bacterium]|nr:carboxylesterase/lipase family protein [Chitinophagaceae bacterium]